MSTERILYYLPKILAVLFIGFLGLFALDVFGTGEPWYMQVTGLFIHLVPNYILIIALLIAFRNEKVGGILFLLLYILAIVVFRADIKGMLLFSPLILIGSLFLIHSNLKNGMRKNSESGYFSYQHKL